MIASVATELGTGKRGEYGSLEPASFVVADPISWLPDGVRDGGGISLTSPRAAPLESIPSLHCATIKRR